MNDELKAEYRSQEPERNAEVGTMNYELKSFHLSFRVHRSSLIVFSMWLVAAIFFVACEREKREFRQAPPSVRANVIAQSDLQPGSVTPPPPTQNPDEENAVAVNEGKRLYDQFNCSGCHAHGGGGAIGPPLIDEKWIYGSDPAQIFSTIVEGRPNGMPSFRQKIPDAQVWELVAYVRSMSGQLSKDVSPTRDDHMNAKESEQRTEKKQPLSTGASKSSEQSK